MHKLDLLQSHSYTVEKPIRKYFITFLMTFCLLFCFKISFGQETYDPTGSPRQWYYNNLESATVGTGSPSTYFPASVSTSANGGLTLVSNSSLNGTKSLSTAGSTTLVGSICWNFLSNSVTTPSNTSLSSSPWEWEFDYKNTTATAPNEDPTAASIAPNSSAWRYWIIATTSKLGFYVTQTSDGKLEGRERFNSATNGYRIIWDVPMAVNKDTYQIRIERSILGYYSVFVFDRTTGTTNSSQDINCTFGDGLDLTKYGLSYLEASSPTANRFQFDNFNFYRVQLDYIPISGNGVSNPIYAGMGTAILYGMDLQMRGDIIMGRLVFNMDPSIADITGVNQPGKLYSTTVLPLTVAGGTLLKTYSLNNGGSSDQQDLSGLNLQYYEGGGTDGTLTHATYYFLTATILTTITTYPTNLSFSVSNTSDNNFSQFFNTSGGASGAPYTSSSSSSVAAPLNSGVVWDWQGAASSKWNSTNAWMRNKQTTTSSPSTSVDIVEIGVSKYGSGSVQPALATADVTIGQLLVGTLATNTGLTSAATLDLNGHTLTIGSGMTVNAGATLQLSNTPTTAGTIAVAGTSTVASTAVINFPTANKVTINNTGTFTLQSDASGAATIGATTTATGTVTGVLSGSYIVQRYLTGGATNSRGYRLLSSPISVSATSLIIPNLTYLNSNSFTTGTGGSGNGFSAGSNGGPTLYFYRENMAPSTTNFTSGNFRGVANINNGSTFSFDGGDANATLPAGNGFMFFFRGSTTTVNPYVTSTVAKTATLSSSGYINQGDITVKDWFTPTLSTLSYTNTGSIANSAIRGYNLVGNPYPSSIDWDKVQAGNTSVGKTIYIYNPTKKLYATYIAGTLLGVGTNFNGTAGGNNIIPSGQGFFVTVGNATTSLVFKESYKSTTQVTSSTLSLATAAASPADELKYLSIELYKDSITNEDALVLFKPTAKTGYVYDEDAAYLKGNSAVNFSTRSTDNIALAINQTNFPTSTQVIPLNVNMTAAGNYQIKLLTAKNIPAAYDVWLMDAYKKDSLDLKNNPTYTFEANVDTATYGNNRFKVVIRQNPALTVHLLSFDAVKSTDDVKLNWTVENEANYTGYVVERSTDGGNTYKVLDSITSAGLGTYNDLDPSPILGTNLYRLKQTDVAGAVSYSNVVKIMYANALNTVLANNNISVYPNPAQSTLNLAVINDTAGAQAAASYKISIVNSSGLVVKTATSTSTNWQTQVDNLMPGTYFIQVINTKNNTLTGKSTFVKL